MMLNIYAKTLILFYIFNNIRTECNISKLRDQHDDSIFAANIMECKNYNSLNDLFYDYIKLVESNYGVKQIKLTKSNLSTIDYLYNPLKNGNIIATLTLNNCGIKNINDMAFEDFTDIEELNLAYNKLEDVNFIPYLSNTTKVLILKNNRIAHIDFNLFKHSFWTLDLSYNQIVSVDFVPKMHENQNYHYNNGNPLFPITEILNLSNNCIKKVQFTSNMQLDRLNLNLAYNPLVTITFNNDWMSIYTLELTESLNSLSDDFPNHRLKVKNKIVLSNSKSLVSKNLKRFVNFDTALPNYYNYQQSRDNIIDIDCKNCSNIDSLLFSNYQYNILNLTGSNLSSFNTENPIFAQSTISSLDLSYSEIESLNNIFQQTSIENLNLAHNKLTTLNENDFLNIINLHWLDISYNPLGILYNSFSNGEKINFLKISYCNITEIDRFAFTGLIQLTTLDLSNNLLTIIEENVFDPLKNIEIINLSGNYLKIIEKRSFYDLRNFNQLIINNNAANLTIQNAAFSLLPSFRKLEIKNSQLKQFNINILAEVPLLQYLDVTDNELVEINFLAHSVKSIKLEELRITYKGSLKQKTFINLLQLKKLIFVNSVIKYLENCPFQGLYKLEKLKFFNTVINNANAGVFCGLFSLLEFDPKPIFINNEKLFKNNINIFSDLKSVIDMNLNNLNIQNLNPLTFQGLVNLKGLDLSHNSLKYLRNSTFFGLINLIKLNLSFNNLTLLKLYDLTHLDNLKILDLSYNHINDIQIGALQSLSMLEELSLKNNNLANLKMGTFSNLLDLKKLDLTNNSLTTLLMEIFLPLKSLTQLMLEFNHLKTIEHLLYVSNIGDLNSISIKNNKWECKYLAEMIITFKKFNIRYLPSDKSFDVENIEGIECVDVCKFLLCSQDKSWN